MKVSRTDCRPVLPARTRLAHAETVRGMSEVGIGKTGQQSKMSSLNMVRNKMLSRIFAVVKRGTPYKHLDLSIS